jgi:hypothetical protein
MEAVATGAGKPQKWLELMGGRTIGNRRQSCHCIDCFCVNQLTGEGESGYNKALKLGWP